MDLKGSKLSSGVIFQDRVVSTVSLTAPPPFSKLSPNQSFHSGVQNQDTGFLRGNLGNKSRFSKAWSEFERVSPGLLV